MDLVLVKVYEVLSSGLHLINNCFLPFRKKYSPKISAVQSNIDYHPDNNVVEKEVEMQGFSLEGSD